MSLQNLLELEDMGRSFSPAERNADLPKPKPHPRARTSKVLSPTLSKGDNGNDDDVVSITSVESGHHNDNDNILGKKKAPTTSSSPKHARFFSSNKSKSAFDNAAFVTDEESEGSEKSNEKSFMPKPLKRNSLVGSGSPKALIKKLEGSNRIIKVGSRDEDSDVNGNDAGESLTDSGKRNASKDKDDDDDDSDSRSDATFTIENEKYKETKRLSKKPPKPTSSPRSSRIPRPQPQTRKSGKLERTPAVAGTPEGGGPDPNKKRESISKNKSESLSTPEKKKEDYVAVPIGSDNDNDDDGQGPIDGNNDKKTVDESETASVSSSVVAPPKETKKSRFGKFFGSSSSSDNKKIKTPPPSADKDKSKSVEEEDKPAGKPSLVNRWRKSAHTFLKTSSKPIEEEAVPGDDAKDESKSSKELITPPPPTTPSSERPHKKKSTETRINMPEESGSEKDDGSSSGNSDEDENEDRDDRDDRDDHDKLDKETASKVKAIQSEEKSKPDEDKPKEQPGRTKERFMPFGKLLRSKSKEKEIQSLKSKDAKKGDAEDEGDLKKVPEPEPTKKLDAKSKFKETTNKLLKEQKRDKGKQKPVTGYKAQSPASSSSDEPDKDLESNSDIEGGTELPIKKFKSPSSKRRKQVATKPTEPLQLIDADSSKELLLGLTIHSSDLLPIDPNVIHPVVKVSVMLQNGQYMKRSNPGESDGGDAMSEGKIDHHGRKHKRRRKRSGLLEEITGNVAESILSIMTQPCQARHSVPTFAPTWNELLVFEEPFRRFVTRNSEPNDNEYDPILLFEVMDFLPMTGNGNSVSVSGFHGTESGWYKVAWAFLKPIGANGVMNVNRKLRLQLYKPVKLRRRERIEGSGPEVFAWWKCGRREKVNATLYVTPKGIRPPETRTASLRQLLSMRKEHLTQAILDSQLATRKKKDKLRSQSLYELREQANWSRMEGQSCKPPNKLLTSLPSSQIESLNIVISGNVHCTKFSPCGYKLAAGLDTDELHVILIFEVPSWTLLKSLTGHHGIIYDIAWKLFELDDYTSYHYMASASADSTVRIWKIDNHQEKAISLFKILYHPSFVYTVKFHPTHPSLLVSGCFDGIIRIWDIKPEHALDLADRRKKSRRKDAKSNEVSPIILLDKHNSFVNCLAFDHVGQHLYSGDGAAYLYKWSCINPSHRKSWKLERDGKLHHGNVPINSIDLHPSGNRILLHLRDNFIKILDAVSFIPLQTLSGLNNEKFQIRSCFSPCGNLVLSGSEQNTLCIWDADTGKIIQFINPRSYPQCTVTSVDYHPFDYYVAAGLTSAISEPSPIMVYSYHQPSKMNYPLLKKTAMRMRQSLEKSRSQSQSTSYDTAEGNDSAHGNRSGSLAAKRGNSSEKFVSIIQKLDSALYLAHQRNKKRETEAKSSTCTTKTVPELRVIKAPPPLNQRNNNDLGNNQTTAGEVPTPGGLYTKRVADRPRSASSSTKEKCERVKNGNLQRDAKSDSEQSSQLKIITTQSDDDDMTGEKRTLRKVKPASRTEMGTAKLPRSRGEMFD